MATISGASLSPIYSRLNSAAAYHPFEAETFADWAMEAGDIVTVSRGDEDYQSPVYSSRMIWRGSPETSVSSTGKKERDPIAKVSRQKYGRGGASMRNQQDLYYEIFSEDGELHSVVQVTASNIRTEVGQTISGMAHSIIEQTATYIRTEVENAASSISASVIEQTAEYVRTEVSSVASGVAWSVVEQTMTGIFQEVARKSKVYRQWSDPNNGVNELHDGDIWIKTKAKRTWNDIKNQSWNTVKNDNTWNALYGSTTYVWKVEDGTGKWQLVTDGAAMKETRTWVEQNDEKYAILAKQVDTQGNAFESNLTVTAQKISTEVTAAKGELKSAIEQTSTSIRAHVEDVKNGLQSSITQTAQSITLSVSASKSELYSTIEQTATQIRMEVANSISDVRSTITQTAESITLSVSASKSELYSVIEQTATQIRSEVANTASGLQSSITQQANRISLVVEGTGANAHIKPASIVSAINDGASSVVISADHINLDGYVKATDLTTDYFSNKIADITNLLAQNVTVNWLGVKYNGTTYDAQYFVRALKLEQSGNTYTLSYARVRDPEWTVVGTFSRAVTSMNRSWSNGTISVTPQPQGTPTFSQTLSHGTPYQDSSDSNRWKMKVTAIVPGTSNPPQYEETGHIIGLYNYLNTKSVTSNGTYYPDTGKIGISSITVNVSNAVSSFNRSWNGGTIYVTPQPQGTPSFSQTLSHGTPYQDSSDSYRWKMQVTAIVPGTSNPPQYENTGHIIPLYNYIHNKTVTSNGTFYPNSGYIGMYAVTVNVPTYSKSANIKCTGKTTSGGLTKYTFEYSTTNSSQFSSGTTYGMHYN